MIARYLPVGVVVLNVEDGGWPGWGVEKGGCGRTCGVDSKGREEEEHGSGVNPFASLARNRADCPCAEWAIRPLKRAAGNVASKANRRQAIGSGQVCLRRGWSYSGSWTRCPTRNSLPTVRALARLAVSMVHSQHPLPVANRANEASFCTLLARRQLVSSRLVCWAQSRRVHECSRRALAAGELLTSFARKKLLSRTTY